jgi:hypothetical protein
MHVYASPRRGYCASCDGRITDRPVYRMDEAYCCVGCAEGGPCVCSYEADLAEDGVDNLGLPFPMDAGTAEPDEAFVPGRRFAPSRETIAS